MATILFDASGNAQLTRGVDLDIMQSYSCMEMRRVTEIHLDSVSRQYFIEWKVRIAADGVDYVKRGNLHGASHHDRIMRKREHEEGEAPVPQPIVKVHLHPDDNVFMFDTYEDAVKYEITCLDELRKKGVVIL